MKDKFDFPSEPQFTQYPPPYSDHPPSQNGLGIAGFVISLVAIPCTCGFLSPVALLLSLIALQSRPRGLAIAGTILSGLGTTFLVSGIIIAVYFPPRYTAEDKEEIETVIGYKVEDQGYDFVTLYDLEVRPLRPSDLEKMEVDFDALIEKNNQGKPGQDDKPADDAPENKQPPPQFGDSDRFNEDAPEAEYSLATARFAGEVLDRDTYGFVRAIVHQDQGWWEVVHLDVRPIK